jgi:GST-like protein
MAKAAAARVARKRKGAAAAAKPSTARRNLTSNSRARRRSPKPIELYYWPTPHGWKISIMLEECGLAYVMKPVAIGRGEQFKSDFLTISPNNRIPAIVDPNGPGGRPVSVFESGAILQYLGRKTGKFYPKDQRKRVQAEEWLYWQMAGLGPMTGQATTS